MRAKKIHLFDSPEDIMKHKKVAFTPWLDGSVRIIFNGTVNPEWEDFNAG